LYKNPVEIIIYREFGQPKQLSFFWGMTGAKDQHRHVSHIMQLHLSITDNKLVGWYLSFNLQVKTKKGQLSNWAICIPAVHS
jgi:hypothetical protein